MKKLLTAVLAVTAACSLCACSLSLPFGKGAAETQPTPTPTPVITAEPTPEPTPIPAPQPEADEEGYVTGADPLTGKPTEPDDNARPVAVMINNRLGAYPQWGLQDAKVIVEGLTEGSTTALMALYSSLDKMPDKVGPVAQGRSLMWQFALPEGSIPVNIGSNVYASNLLNYLQWQNIDGYYAGVAAFDLDHQRASNTLHEYCWYTKPALLRDGLDLYGMNEDGNRRSLFNFAPDGDYDLTAVAPADNTDTNATLNIAQPADRLEITFYPECTVPVLYNEETGRWEKYDINWELHMDGYAIQQDGADPAGEDFDGSDYSLQFDNVLVLYASAGVKDDGYSRDYLLTEGTGLYFRGPYCRLIRWQKAGATGGLHIYDAYGEPLDVGTGTTYLAIYGGFDGQSIRSQSNGSDLTLWPNPAPLPDRELYQPAEAEEEPQEEDTEQNNG